MQEVVQARRMVFYFEQSLEKAVDLKNYCTIPHKGI